MTLEFHQPKTEALNQQQLASGAFHDVEEVLLYALRSVPVRRKNADPQPRRMGSELIGAMQAMPCKDVDLDPSRLSLPIREPEF